MTDERLFNQLDRDRINTRQVHEFAADGALNQAEIELLQTWLTANRAITDQLPDPPADRASP
ncbi:MAG: hypothetical protein K2P58_15775 [Hyphomonadaceae bacterium]|nr:hypothetical protein [Hyphomonadaceae bacterium]